MSKIIHFLRIIYLLSKYRLFHNLISRDKFPFLHFCYNFISCLFWPANLWNNKPIDKEQIATLFIKLGPIYIKFGQTLATRSDIIGQDMALNLQQLQDKLPPFCSATACNIVERELDANLNTIFSHFERASTSSASVAQVHKATLLSGQQVAVKILRPNIDKTYAKDIALLSFLAKIVTRMLPKTKKLKLPEVVKVFETSMQMELNLKLEAANCSELAANIVNDEYIVPQIYWHLTTRKVLVTQWIDGISLHNSNELSVFDTKLLSQKLAHMFFNQTYRDGFFHADLHHGNVFITKQGQIALIDFGIMGRLSDKDRLAVAQILYHFLKRDYFKVAKAHLAAGYIPAHTDLNMFAQYCRSVCEPIVGLALKDVSISKILAQLFEVIETFGLEIQPQLILLQKSMILIEGIGKSLNQDINMWELAYPWMQDWAVKNISIEARLIKGISQFISNCAQYF
jgi:ubiquinone biosynthesis protein